MFRSRQGFRFGTAFLRSRKRVSDLDKAFALDKVAALDDIFLSRQRFQLRQCDESRGHLAVDFKSVPESGRRRFLW